ncbi:MAG: hypothetical protein AB7P99_02620 [Vicinamibacterales bacterium]
MNGRARRSVIATLLALVLLASAGLCEAAMGLLASGASPTAMPPGCTAHDTPAEDAGRDSGTSPRVASCCAIDPDLPVPAAPLVDVTAAIGVPRVPTLLCDLARVPVLLTTSPPLSSPIRQTAAPPHLLYSVFLV